MPKVSIIIPVYNVEKYLRECLDSVVNQTLSDIEIICVNDGSTDSSPQILKEYADKDSRVKVINKENSGYGASINIGLDNATGEYIGIIESDDYAEPNMFENLYNLAKENDADIVKSAWYYYFSVPMVRNIKTNAFKNFKTNSVLNISIDPDIFAIMPTIWSAIYKHSLITDNKIRLLETMGASFQDTSFAFKVNSYAERIVLTDNAYVHYRQDNENSSINSQSKVMAICCEYKEIADFLNSNPKINSIARIYKRVNQYSGYTWNLGRIATNYQKEFINKFRDDFKDAYLNKELGSTFFKIIGNKETKKLDLLINNPDKYYKKFIKNQRKEKLKDFRRNIIQVRWNKNKHCIKLFGKNLYYKDMTIKK